MRIVLLGDLHFYKLGVWPWELLGKRIWGQTNLWLRRRRSFRMERWPGIVARVREMKPDQLLFAGDLVTTALPGEFELAKRALTPLLGEFPGGVIVPGNHDRHSFTSARKKMLEAAFPGFVPERFPYHREMGGGLHLIALNPSRANVISDTGLLGERQLGELDVLLEKISKSTGGQAASGTRRVIVLCHYTLGTPPGTHREMRRHMMMDAGPLREMLARHGHETLYLHGHVHRPWVWRLPDAANVVTVNAGAPMMSNARFPHGQGFWVIETEPAWRLTHHSMGADGSWRAVPVEVPTQKGVAEVLR